MRTYLVIRGGEVKLRIPLDESGNGTLWSGDYPLLLTIEGGITKDEMSRLMKSRKYTEIPPENFARRGENPRAGALVLTDEEWARHPIRVEQIRKIREEEESRRNRLNEMFPGLNELRRVRNDESRYHDQFTRMMEDGNNDGALPPSPVIGSSRELSAKYPAARIYLKLESWKNSCSMSGKSGVGTRGIERLERGENPEQVEKDCENEWSEIAQRACDNS